MKLDGKYLGEDIKLLLPRLPEKVTLFCTPTGIGNGGHVTFREANFLSLSRTFPEVARDVGFKAFFLETIAFNRFGWDYAKILCELLILPGSWRASVIEEIEAFLARTRPEVYVEGFVRKLARALKKLS